MIRVIRRADDSLQLALVQPIHRTRLARVDHHVPRTSIYMVVHRLRTSWANPRKPVSRLRPRRKHRCRPVPVGMQRLHQCQELIHIDQHSPAFAAIQQRMLLQLAIGEQAGASGTFEFGIAQHLNAVVTDGRRELAPAIVTNEDPLSRSRRAGAPQLPQVILTNYRQLKADFMSSGARKVNNSLPSPDNLKS